MTDNGRQTFINLLWFAIAAIVLVAVVAIAFGLARDYQTKTRGIEFGARAETAFGVNASLEQYSDADLARALTLMREGGFRYIRQHFDWNELEPRQGAFAWDKSDRIVARASESDLQLIAVIDTTPVWARHPGEADLVNAPPANPDDYGRFIAAFVKRYGDRVRYLQIWDNPNVHPFWGRRNADPLEYAALLRAGTTAARAANPQIKILAAGLAPSGELVRGHPDYSDILFLRGLYEVGARDYFDIVAAKPYGMWSGPDDRRVDMEVFNFSRAILLRDEMLAYSDANKPVWAVEFGWNALPKDWRGTLRASPWGSDTEETQSVRLTNAVQRAKSEWAWMPVLIVQTFQPNAPNDDPVWGFALVDKNFQPRSLYTALTRAIAMPVQPAVFDFTRLEVLLGALAFVAVVAVWRGGLAAWQLPWENIWQPIQVRFAAMPELVQFALLAGTTVALYYSPNVVLNLVLLAFLVFLFALRLDLGLAITVFTIPFYLLPKNLVGGAQFSMVELLVLVSVAAWALHQVKSQKFKVKSDIFIAGEVKQSSSRVQEIASSPHPLLRITISTFTFCLFSFDLVIIAFVLLGILSVKLAGNFGVASREFRVIVIEPAMLYALIRTSSLSRRALGRLVDAFILSALAISLVGLYQFLFTNWVIIGEGVRRVLAVYGSPNNLALYLDRALPMVIALGLLVENRKSRIAYALTALVIALCLYLTYSRGSWLGIAAGLAFIGLASEKRVRIAMIVLLVVGVVAVIPFLQTERAQSLFQIGVGTGFFRVSVWESAIAMIRDHPIFGVGLDNFLYEYPKYIKPDAWREPNLSHPHNLVLDFWARLGIPGVVVLVWMLFEFYRRGIRAGTRPAPTRALVIGLMASMTAALAHGMIDAAYFYVDLAFGWMLTFGVMMQLGDEVIE